MAEQSYPSILKIFLPDSPLKKQNPEKYSQGFV